MGKMKTTLEIPDELFRKAKAKAALDGLKLKDLVAEGLRMVTEESMKKQKGKYVRFPIIKTRHGAGKLLITDKRIKELELEADLDRHTASL